MRVLKQVAAVVGVSCAASAAVGAVGASWVAPVVGAVAAAVTVAVYAWVVRRTESRVVHEVATRGAARSLGRGVAVGLLMFAAVIGVIALAGGYRVAGAGSVSAAVGVLGVVAVAAVTEELMFRGVLMRLLEERTGTLGALGLSAAVFGAVHLLNPGATVWGATAVAIEAGLMLGAAYAATRTLWLPIGVHLGWNFAEAGIFGTEVSGSGVSEGLLHGVTSGPALFTGGTFGPEGSLVAVTAGLVLTAVFLRVAHRRGHLLPPRSRRTDGAAAPAHDAATVSP